MVSRKKKAMGDRTPRVIVHPELHSTLMRVRAETGESIQGQVHEILCRHLKREDLLSPAAAAS